MPPVRNVRNLVAAAVAIAAVSLAVLGSLAFGGKNVAPSHAVPTALARIVRTDVTERQQVSGTLDYRGSYSVVSGPTGGVVTWLPTAGSIVRRGRPLFELDGRPVPLLYGGRPAHRTLALGMTDGPDVRALKRNLLTLGFTDGGGVTLDSHFDRATLVGVEQLQRSLALPETGTLRLGDIVFLAGPVRVSATTAAVGAFVQPWTPILVGTTPDPAVLIDLDPGSVAQLEEGDDVLVTMPDGSTAPGTVSSIGRVATIPSGQGDNGGQGSSTPTIPVTISLGRRANGGLDHAPVQVAITIQQDRHVLAVPINALLARPGGGYAVDLATGRSTRRVPVTIGLFDDVAGHVEISGPGLAPGMRVQVPAA
jgi:hypothetical protein